MIDHVQFGECCTDFFDGSHTLESNPVGERENTMHRWDDGELDELTFGRFPRWHLVLRRARACRGTLSVCAWAFGRGRLAQRESIFVE